MKRFRAILHARNMEFVRDRGTLIWNILFPVLLVFGFAFAFRGDGNTVFSVGYLGDIPENLTFFTLDHVEYIPYEDLDDAVEKVRFHQVDFFIDTRDDTYYVNESSPNGTLVQNLLKSLHPDSYEQLVVTGRPVRYVDWLVPGIIGMNMMFSGVFGVGFVLVRYRKNGVLKRIKATPVHPFEFVSAQVASRFLIVVITSIVVFTGTNLALRFMMLGSYVLLLILTMVSVFCMISLGLVFATRLKSEEMASGLINIITVPMLLVSGVFFSLEGSPPILQNISKFFPLTYFIDGARSIMLEGAGFVDLLPSFLALGIFTIIFLTSASLLFRWE